MQLSLSKKMSNCEYKKLKNLQLKAEQLLTVIEEEWIMLDIGEREITQAQDLYGQLKESSKHLSDNDDFEMPINVVLMKNFEDTIEAFFDETESIFKNFERGFIEHLINKHSKIHQVLLY